jgi:hypothetical protein
MNGNVKCVEKQGINIESMHVKCKSIIIVVWNNFVGIKFHFYHPFQINIGYLARLNGYGMWFLHQNLASIGDK